ncbi:unnamed protein product [Clonostachys rhizophaga]|uniref:Uncharacterized protein n=1 Tax=Clonostachys rhizophaga TaxID=160324 RepID=A0A9N9YR54_9HYPO|nr:unnamed protein product [Clonostachys rhizophaga]
MLFLVSLKYTLEGRIALSYNQMCDFHLRTFLNLGLKLALSDFRHLSPSILPPNDTNPSGQEDGDNYHGNGTFPESLRNKGQV